MRHNLDIQSVDILVKMYALKNVKLVAESVGKSSSAISKILSKLKMHFEDPLFIQAKNGFEPTTFMDTNIAHFELILTNFDAIQHTTFDPQTLKQDIFKIFPLFHCQSAVHNDFDLSFVGEKSENVTIDNSVNLFSCRDFLNLFNDTTNTD